MLERALPFKHSGIAGDPRLELHGPAQALTWLREFRDRLLRLLRLLGDFITRGGPLS